MRKSPSRYLVAKALPWQRGAHPKRTRSAKRAASSPEQRAGSKEQTKDSSRLMALARDSALLLVLRRFVLAIQRVFQGGVSDMSNC